jgi:carbon monoxide dehydrogenase subunit G
MRIENTLEVDAPLDRVWALVNDIPRVAPCMPGAALTGVLDDKTYEGTVAVKLGPLRMSYKGKVTVDEVDEANHSARLTASGRDVKGSGTAKANVETRLEPAGDTRTRLKVTSDVQLTGKVASFGRGGAINDVATRLFGQFADCLRDTLEAGPGAAEAGDAAASATTGAPPSGVVTGSPPAAGTTGTAAADPAMEAPATTAAPDAPAAGAATGSPAAGATSGSPAAGATSGSPAAGATSGAPPAATVTPGSAPVSPAPPPRAAEALDAGSLVGTVIKGRLTALFQAIAGFFRRLFRRRG